MKVRGLLAIASVVAACGGSTSAPKPAAKPSTGTAPAPSLVGSSSLPQAGPPATATTLAPGATSNAGQLIAVRERELREGFNQTVKERSSSCYQEEYRTNRTAAGRITFTFEVNAEGAIERPVVDDSKKGSLSTALIKCLTDAVTSAKLAPRPGSEPVHITYPFVFTNDVRPQGGKS